MGVRWRGRRREAGKERMWGKREQRETGKDRAYLLKIWRSQYHFDYCYIWLETKLWTFGQIAYHLNYTDLPRRVWHVNISCPSDSHNMGAGQDTPSLQGIIFKRKEERAKLNICRSFFQRNYRKMWEVRKVGRDGTQGQWKSFQKAMK